MSNPRAKILVVDDEKLIRWSVSERLTRGGKIVESAETAEESLERLASFRPDVVLMDVKLPGMDGITAVRRILALQPDVVVVMMSAHSTVDMAVSAMKDGAVDFLVKPFALSLLDETVEKALATAATRKRTLPSSNTKASEVVGSSAAMAQLREMVSRLATSGATTVLVEGESGTGKEVVARSIHYQSPRAERPFLQINCAAMPEQLLESELFGHERGAFTDAKVQKRGLFENADGGTVMLDEIGDLPPGGQAKLLRLLENKTFRRVGGIHEMKADVRVVAATNVDLDEQVHGGRFRADLMFRLNVVRIRVAPLRERVSDIPELAAHFISRFNQEMSTSVRGLSPQTLSRMFAHAWPGNVRELRNVIERALILHPGIDEIRPEHLPPEMNEAGSDSPREAAREEATPLSGQPEGGTGQMSLTDSERRLIVEAMEKAHGNQTHAAKLLGISRDTLRYRLRKHGLT